MSLYDSNKVLQHLDVLEAVAAGATPAPTHVRIEPTEACNFRCRFCWTQDPERLEALRGFADFDSTGARRFELPRLLALIDELADAGTKAVSFVAVGDPLVYPQIERVIARARERQLAIGVTSNLAMKLSPALVQELAACNWVRWSMNAGSEAAYIAVNQPRTHDQHAVYRRVQDNVTAILEARRRLGSAMKLNASVVVSEWNEADIEGAAEFASRLGIDSVSFRPDMGHQRQDKPSQANDRNAAALAAVKARFTAPGFAVHVETERQEEVVFIEKDRDVVCHYSNHSIYIAANGDVYPCCYTRSDKRYVIGNIAGKAFGEFWHSPARQAHFRTLSIASCPSCPYYDINAQLRGLYEGQASPQELHVPGISPDPFV